MSLSVMDALLTQSCAFKCQLVGLYFSLRTERIHIGYVLRCWGFCRVVGVFCRFTEEDAVISGTSRHFSMNSSTPGEISSPGSSPSLWPRQRIRNHVTSPLDMVNIEVKLTEESSPLALSKSRDSEMSFRRPIFESYTNARMTYKNDRMAYIYIRRFLCNILNKIYKKMTVKNLNLN